LDSKYRFKWSYHNGNSSINVAGIIESTYENDNGGAANYTHYPNALEINKDYFFNSEIINLDVIEIDTNSILCSAQYNIVDWSDTKRFIGNLDEQPKKPFNQGDVYKNSTDGNFYICKDIVDGGIWSVYTPSKSVIDSKNNYYIKYDKIE
jgi:hypothetical protein